MINLKKDYSCIKAFLQIDLDSFHFITRMIYPECILATMFLKIIKLKISVVIAYAFANLLVGGIEKRYCSAFGAFVLAI